MRALVFTAHGSLGFVEHDICGNRAKQRMPADAKSGAPRSAFQLLRPHDWVRQCPQWGRMTRRRRWLTRAPAMGHEDQFPRPGQRARRNSSSFARRALTSIVPDLTFLMLMVCILAP